MVTALVIVYGAAIALRAAVFPQTALSWQEGAIWFVAAVILGSVAGIREYLSRRASDHQLTELRDQLIRVQTWNEAITSFLGRSINRMEAEPETTPKREQIVGELKEGLKELGDSAKALTESSSQRSMVSTRAQKITTRILQGFLTVLLFILVTLVGLTVRAIYLQFPAPLSPAQMADLADRLRSEAPQKVLIVRSDDRQSIALSEQFKTVFASAHWTLVSPPRPPNAGVVLLRGLVIWRAPADNQPLVLSRALYFLGLTYLTKTNIDLAGAGYFELSISDSWLFSYE